jgi:hypothetical protein
LLSYADEGRSFGDAPVSLERIGCAEFLLIYAVGGRSLEDAPVILKRMSCAEFLLIYADGGDAPLVLELLHRIRCFTRDYLSHIRLFWRTLFKAAG